MRYVAVVLPPSTVLRKAFTLNERFFLALAMKEEVPEKEGPETPPDSPLLDVSDVAIKKLVLSAKRGYVTHDQINSLSKEVNSEQIEDILARFSEMGVNVVETEEGEEQQADEEPESEGGELVEVQQKVPAKSEAKEPIERTDDPVRMYLVPWRGSATFRSRGRLCAAEAGTSSLKSEYVPKAVE